MAGMQALRKQAKQAGVSAKEIRSAESSAELRQMIKSAGSNGGGSAPRKKAAVKKAVAKASGAKRGRGRPKGSTNKSTAKRGRPAKSASNGNGGRFLLSGVNFSQTDGWNPREGSVPDVIVKALRKAKGNRDKAFDALRPKLDSLVLKKTRDGRTRTKDERIDYLRYLISRNAWAFALATGQHERSENRAEYGTAGTGTGAFKRGKTRKATGSSKTAKRGRGRPKGSTSAKKSTGARRGRPPGSKNKAKAAGAKAARKRK
jgi:hypothetical protein